MLKFNPSAIGLIILFTIGSLLSYDAIRFYTYGEKAEATTISSKKIPRKSDSFKDVYSTYASFTVKDKTYKKHFQTPAKLKLGSTFIVYYLPHDPSVSTHYKDEGEIIRRPLLFGVMLLIAVLYVAITKKNQ